MEALKMSSHSPNLADLVEEQYVKHEYTEDELTEFRFRLGESSVKVEGLEIEKKEANQKFETILKPIKGEVKEYISRLKMGYEMNRQMVYGYKDFEAGTITFYTADGEFASKRRMVDSEFQHTLKLNS